jgi:recombination protein RecA
MLCCVPWQVYGPEASGKTTLALHAVAEVQKAGGQAVFVDAEHAFNIHFARRLGVNVDVSIVGGFGVGKGD